MDTLKAEKRGMDVKAKQLRRQGFVVGCLVGRDVKEPTPLKFQGKDALQFMKHNKKGAHMTLDIDGKKVDAMLKDISYDALKKQISYMDFQALVADEKIHATTPIVLLNEDIIDGIAQQELSEIEYKAYPADLVDAIEIDLTKYAVGDSIHVKDLEMSKNDKITVVTPEDSVVVHIANHGMAPEDEEEEEAAE